MEKEGKHGKASKRRFQPANGMRSTHSLVKILNTGSNATSSYSEDLVKMGKSEACDNKISEGFCSKVWKNITIYYNDPLMLFLYM